MITVTGVEKAYGSFQAPARRLVGHPARQPHRAARPVRLGQVDAAGVIAGLEVPTGSVIIDGEDVTHLAPQQREIGFVFQHYAAFKHMTVQENVAFGPKIRRVPKAQVKAKVADLLGVVGLSGYQDRYPSQLSGGQRQRMALARALAVEPRVLLLDEPFGALDAKVRAELRAWLRRLHDEVHVTTVLVTHDQEEALDVSDRIAVLDAGRVVQTGTPRELYDEPANDFVMGFLGEVAQVGAARVRPHDLRLANDPVDGGHEAQVVRVVHLGFEVRVELELADSAAPVHVQLTRAEADALELRRGDVVYVRAEGRTPVRAAA
jgi:sulfate transport system ATP-binding protein